MEKDGLVVFLEEGASVLNQEEDVLLKRNVAAFVVKVRNAGCLCRGSVLPQLRKKRKLALLLDAVVASSNVAYVFCSRVASQESLGHHLCGDVHHAQVDKAYGIVFLELSHVAQQFPKPIRERCLTAHDRRQYIGYFA